MVAVLASCKRAASRGRLRQPVHGFGESDVALGDAAGIMGRERHLDLVVDVEPFRVMIELLCEKRGASHEAERRVEIFEGESPADGVATLHLAPACKPRQRCPARAAGQFLGHGRLLVAANCATNRVPTATRKGGRNAYLMHASGSFCLV